MVFPVEVYAIGSELCYGRVYDANSFWIAEQATRLGAHVTRITCVRDEASEIAAALGEGLSRGSRFLFTTGGLGSTQDDKTVEAISLLTGRPVRIAGHVLKAMAERRGVPVDQLPPNLVRMARTVEGADCLPNPLGWAPVTVARVGSSTLVAMPGPPREVQACWERHVAQMLRDSTDLVGVARRVAVAMLESEVSPLIDRVMKSVQGVYLKPLVSQYKEGVGLPIDVVAFAETDEASGRRLREAVEQLRALVNERGRRLVEPL